MLTDPLRLSIAPPHVWRDTPMPDGGPPLDDDAAMPIAGHITFEELLRVTMADCRDSQGGWRRS